MLDSKWPALKIADNNTEKKATLKFLVVMLDKNKTFEEHTCTVNKLAKNIGLIDRT